MSLCKIDKLIQNQFNGDERKKERQKRKRRRRRRRILDELMQNPFNGDEGKKKDYFSGFSIKELGSVRLCPTLIIS